MTVSEHRLSLPTPTTEMTVLTGQTSVHFGLQQPEPALDTAHAAGPGLRGGGGQTGTSPLFLVADSCLLFWDSAASFAASPLCIPLLLPWGLRLVPPSQEALECGSGRAAGLGTADPGSKTTEKLGPWTAF